MLLCRAINCSSCTSSLPTAGLNVLKSTRGTEPAYSLMLPVMTTVTLPLPPTFSLNKKKTLFFKEKLDPAR